MAGVRLWKIGGRPVVLAHRGGGNEVPENSIEAFRTMRDRGFNYIETDCHATADGIAVVFHDPILDRVTDASGRISDWAWDDLRHVKDQSENRIVRLDELLEEFPEIVFNLDAKHNRAVKPMIETIRRADALDRVSLASFSEARLVYMRRKLPGVRSSLGTLAIARLVIAAKAPKGVRTAMIRGLPGPKRGVEAVQVPEAFKTIHVVDEAFIALAHSRGLAVHVWTVNERDDMEKLLNLGIDGLITDEPTLAREVIDQRFGNGAN